MDTSLWSQPGSVFNSRFSLFSPAAQSTAVLSSPRPGELVLPWIGARGVRISWVTADTPVGDDRKAAIPESAVTAWNRIRLELAIAPFQTLVRPTCEGPSVINDFWIDESSVNVPTHAGRLGVPYNAGEPELYVRTRSFAPMFGQFLRRDPA